MAIKKVDVLLIDDSQQDLLLLENLLTTHPNVSVKGTATDPRTALPLVRELKPDLVFVDIQMPGKNGFEVVEELFELPVSPDVIFVTAFDHFAIRAIRQAAFDFLLKPVKSDELAQVIDRWLNNSGKKDRNSQIERLRTHNQLPQKIKVNTTNGFTMIEPQDVVYIQADWNYSEFYLVPGETELVTINLGALEEILPATMFFRISRALIINLSYLKSVNRKKKTITLVKDHREFNFSIPLLNIRKLERFLEHG